MKKFILLFMVFMLVMPVYVGMAQDDALLTRLQVYNASFPQGYGVTTVEDFNTLLAQKEFVLLDVREKSEYKAGHIPGAVNIPIRELGQNLALLPDLNADIMVICKAGGRAMLAMTSLNILGYNNARMLKGGYDAWVAAEMPTTTEDFLSETGVTPEIDPHILQAVDTYLSTLPEGFSLVAPADVAIEIGQNPPILIDVRKQDELDKDGYIAGAQHIWINELMSRQSELPADKSANIVIYCGSGFRGGIATVMLELLGYSNVRNMSGGFGAWKATGLPITGGFRLDTYLSDYVVALPDTFNTLNVDELAAELTSNPELVVVDVRTPDEYVEGHIEGAINIPLTELTQNLTLLPNLDENIVVVCGSGHRSALAMTTLTVLGYHNVRSLISGMGAWTNAEQPVTTEPFEMEAATAPTINPLVFEPVNNFMTSIPASYYTVKAVDLGVEMMGNPPVLIDLRTDSEWAEGYIEGAIHIELRDFMANISNLPENKAAPIVLYDNPTHRSSMALVFMKLLGYENVRVLGGGISAWTAVGLPLVTN